MPTELWLAAQREVDQLVAIVANDSNYSIQEISEDYDELAEQSPSADKGVVRIYGSFISFIDDEYMFMFRYLPLISLLDLFNCYYSRTCHTLK